MKFVLSALERQEVSRLVEKVVDNFRGFDDEKFLKDLPINAYQLPVRLVEFINDFKYEPPSAGYAVVNMGILENEKIESTPPHWDLETNNKSCEKSVISMCLCAAILGDLFGWITQQDGRIVHDILPIEKYKSEQLGSGSEVELTLHTEDAFHEFRGDYLVMMCLRNPGGIPTMLSKPDYSRLTKKQIDLLFEEHFVIRPDNSHKIENASSERVITMQAYKNQKVIDAYNEIEACCSVPRKVAVLFGQRDRPFLRLDPYFMEEPSHPEARDALRQLINIVDDMVVDVALNPGEILIVDNYEVVHGRRPFSARYDGSDRWYKRLNVIRDIRRCQKKLESRTSRVIL